MKRALLLALLARAALSAPANPFPWASPRKLWPPDAGVADVTRWGAVGDGVTDLKPGDRVVFTSYAGEPFKIGDDELLLMREDDILAILG
jgi:hypothetical protein